MQRRRPRRHGHDQGSAPPVRDIPELTRRLAAMKRNEGKEMDDWSDEDRRSSRPPTARPNTPSASPSPPTPPSARWSCPACSPLLAGRLVGFLGGAEMLGGLLAGVTVTGVLMAIFQSNAGGAWDNAKKMFEEGVEIDGKLYNKGSDPHKAAVVGDTVGDPFKDTSGPSLNILLKLMSVVALVIARRERAGGPEVVPGRREPELAAARVEDRQRGDHGGEDAGEDHRHLDDGPHVKRFSARRVAVVTCAAKASAAIIPSCMPNGQGRGIVSPLLSLADEQHQPTTPARKKKLCQPRCAAAGVRLISSSKRSCGIFHFVLVAGAGRGR
jgi:hypothetical protein